MGISNGEWSPPTELFRRRMRPHAIAIYQQLFGGCHVEDLRENGVRVHVLDREFAIDSLIHLSTNQWVSIQEKYRNHAALGFRTRGGTYQGSYEFTQEYMNAYGTNYESEGEWFHLAAQLYFYGWANMSETAFERWILADVTKYKLWVHESGGLDRVGTLEQNRRHGRASFYAIPIDALRDAGVIIAEFSPSMRDLPF